MARKLPPIRTTVERIDGAMLAVVVYCYRVGRRRVYDAKVKATVQRPFLYGWSTWALVDRPISRHEAIERGEAMIRAEWERSHWLPAIGWCGDLPGWAEFE